MAQDKLTMYNIRHSYLAESGTKLQTVKYPVKTIFTKM